MVFIESVTKVILSSPISLNIETPCQDLMMLSVATSLFSVGWSFNTQHLHSIWKQWLIKYSKRAWTSTRSSQAFKLAENLYSRSQCLFIAWAMSAKCLHSLLFCTSWYLNRFDTGTHHFHSSKCSQCSNAITPCVPEKLITFGEQSQLRSLWKKGAKERDRLGGGGVRWGLKHCAE